MTHSSNHLVVRSRSGVRTIDPDLVVGKYLFFSPEVMRLGREVSVPLSSSELDLFIDFATSDLEESPVGRTIYLLSVMGRIMDFMQPLDEFWWRRCVVDEAVEDRESALSNLGLYVRSGGIESIPYYVYLGIEPNLIEGGFRLRYDPVWHLEKTLLEAGEVSTWSGKWTTQIRDRALEIEWMNHLYGILESAWLIEASLAEGSVADDSRIHTGYINWKDVARFMPSLVTVHGIVPPIHDMIGLRIDYQLVMSILEEQQRDVGGMISSAVAALSLSSRPVIPFYHHQVFYTYRSSNRRDLSLYLIQPGFVYLRMLEYAVMRMDSKNVKQVALSLGLAPLLTGGKRGDIESILPERDPVAARRALVAAGLIPLGSEEDWSEIENMPSAEQMKRRGRINPLFHNAIPGNDGVLVYNAAFDQDYSHSREGRVITRRYRMGITTGGISGDSHHVTIVPMSDLINGVLRMGYYDPILAASRSYRHYKSRVNVLHLPALLHDQAIFRYPGADDTEVTHNYPSIVKYMKETIGGEAMSLIASVLMLYVETYDDSNAESFVELLLDNIVGDSSFIRVP